MNPHPPRVAMLTCAAFPTLYREEEGLIPAFAAAGVEAIPVVWSDPSVELSSFDLVVFRSVWDYFERLPAFRAWLARLAGSGIPVINAPSLIEWNLDKAYLIELASRGVRIIPTLHFKGGPPKSLRQILEDAGWQRAVVKPAISGGAYRTYLIDRASAAAHDAEAEALRAGVGLLVQPYLPQIEREGEYSLLFFEGVFSHAVLKKPVADEFRVQMTFGGTSTRVSPSPRMLESAKQVLAALPQAPLYARVDGVVLDDGELHLMEVELIEPYLFLEAAPEAQARYVDAIARAAQAQRHQRSL